MTSKLTDEQIEAAKAAGFYWHPVQKCLCTRHSSGAWVAVDDMLARFVALLAPTQQPSGEVTDDKNVYVSVRFKDAVVRRSITTAELDSLESTETLARLFGSVVLGAIDAARARGHVS
ncbi:hypothetical protein KTE68_14030 [Burkholderia multivorans]|uniref:hypothetical protein n=1 Tax=Burkholderia multivorans TaxID=87883 RepID=UPI001C22B951|nr:hypothetical protein [Burkholderia multivorans]MBU9501292.1 hypothetical protein [Burkholderia multivorans]